MSDVIRWDEWDKGFSPAAIGMRCNIEQYRIIRRCSKEKDTSEWNDWRKRNPGAEIWLCGVSLVEAYLKQALLCGRTFPVEVNGRWEHLDFAPVHLDGADLRRANLNGANLEDAHLNGGGLLLAHLEGGNLGDVHLRGSQLQMAHLDRASARGARLDGTNLREAHLEGAQCAASSLTRADLRRANLNNGTFYVVDLSDADLRGAYLQHTKLGRSHLSGARLRAAHLEGADLAPEVDLRRADFTAAIVDAETVIWDAKVDKDTLFTGVGLDAARVEPGLKQTFEYNTRRHRWVEWYERNRNGWFVRLLRWVCRNPQRAEEEGGCSSERNWTDWYDEHIGGWLGALLRNTFVRPFWWVSDYGRSTWRIVVTFFVLALAFGTVYYSVGAYNPPGVVANLFEKDGVAVPTELVLYRAIYFSIVTMTTLGFGDIYARPDSLLGHALLAVQVILGYVLLGALVTRFAVLFSGRGPAAKLSPKWKPPKSSRKTERGVR